MKLSFLGTKGYIKASSKAHKMHTSTMISYKNTKILIDCGEDWIKKAKKLSCDFLLLTHAHPDHAFGLKKGINCPVYATKDTWKELKKFPIMKKRIMNKRKKTKIGSIFIEAFSVIHSINSPCVGYKIQAGRKKIFYAPDIVWIRGMKTALKDTILFIGDGATICRPMIRKSKKTKEIFGHTTIKQQLTWCKKYNIPKMIVTHCGSNIVKNEKKAKKAIEELAKKRNVKVKIAHDNMQITI